MNYDFLTSYLIFTIPVQMVAQSAKTIWYKTLINNPTILDQRFQIMFHFYFYLIGVLEFIKCLILPLKGKFLEQKHEFLLATLRQLKRLFKSTRLIHEKVAIVTCLNNNQIGNDVLVGITIIVAGRSAGFPVFFNGTSCIFNYFKYE